MTRSGAKQAVVGAGLMLIVSSSACRQLVGFEQQTPGAEAAGGEGAGERVSDGFESPEVFADSVVSWLSTADFDGDGRLDIVSAEEPDLLAQARFSLHYFGADGAWESRAFPKVTTRPVSRDVDGDGRSDLAFSNFNVGLLPGRANRAWLPAAFSSYVLPQTALRLVGVGDHSVDNVSGVVLLAMLDGVTGVYFPSSSTVRFELLAELEAPPEQLTSDPVAADLVKGRSSPCKELILAFEGASSFRVLDLCEAGDGALTPETRWRQQPLEQVVRLPDGMTLDRGGPLVADIDGDEHLDVLVGCSGHACVAHGDGQQLEPVVARLALQLRGSAEPSDLGMPIAAGDFTDDGVADFVLPDRLLGSSPLPESSGFVYDFGPANNGQPWALAVIADLNGNDFPDVVVAPASGTGLTFFNGTGGPYPQPMPLATKSPVRLLATGDLDGDLVHDIAIVEGAEDEPSAERLALSFGSLNAFPDAPHPVTELANVEQLGAFGGFGLDNLFVVSRSVTEGESSSALAFFNGGADRLPLATSQLTNFSYDGSIFSSPALALSVGAFSDPERSDVIALAGQDTSAFWLLANVGDTRALPRLLEGALPEEAYPLSHEVTSTKLSVASAAADVDGDGLDESLWLMPQGYDGCLLAVYALDDAATAIVSKGSVSFNEACPNPELAVQDLDGSGGVDVLVLIGDSAAAPRRLQILWNDGEGGFSLSEQSTVADPDHDIRGFSAFGPGSHQIALVNDEALLLAAATEADPESYAITRVRSFNEPRSVVVTDVNGDGFVDLAVADADGISLLGAHFK